MLRLYTISDRWRNVEHCWNDTEGGRPKYLEKTLSQWQFIHHKLHMDWPGIEPGPPRRVAGI